LREGEIGFAFGLRASHCVESRHVGLPATLVQTVG
jgi:hypothetical protein